jgi:hypothetical protein
MSLPPASPLKRRPGGQKGNHNALKHGFYAHQLDPDETAFLARINAGSIDTEIALNRRSLGRLVEAGRTPADFQTISRLLHRFTWMVDELTCTLNGRAHLKDLEEVNEAIR